MTKKSERQHQTKSATQETYLFFCAHPDDEAIGAGGTIAKYAQEGKKIVVVICTSGENSHPWKKRNVVIRQRKKEADISAKILGVTKLYHWDYPDGSLLKQIKEKPISNEILKVIKKYKPTKVFTHSRDDAVYPDHIAVHKSTVQAFDTYNASLAETKKAELFTFNIWALSILNRNKPQLHVDISTTFELKKKAIACFKSQGVALMQLWPTIFYKAIVNGFRRDTKYAEHFFKIR